MSAGTDPIPLARTRGGGWTDTGRRDARLALSWHIRGTIRTQRQPQKDWRATCLRHGAGHGDARRTMRSRPSVSELSSTSALHRVARLVLDATHLFWELRGLLDGASPPVPSARNATPIEVQRRGAGFVQSSFRSPAGHTPDGCGRRNWSRVGSRGGAPAPAAAVAHRPMHCVWKWRAPVCRRSCSSAGCPARPAPGEQDAAFRARRTPRCGRTSLCCVA